MDRFASLLTALFVLTGSAVLPQFIVRRQPPVTIACDGTTTICVSQGGGVFSGGSACNGQTATALASVTWTAGKTYVLCGSITSQVAPNASGSSGNVITILFDRDAILAPATCSSTGCINLNGRSWFVVNGGTNGTIQPTGSAIHAYGIFADTSGMSNVEVKNLTIANLDVHVAGGTPSSCGVNVSDAAAFYYKGSNNHIHHNTIHDANAGVHVHPTGSGDEIDHNTIYNINWGVFLNGGATVNGIQATLIHDNEVYDFANWDNPAASGGANCYHHDGIFIAGSNGSSNTLLDNQIYNNYIHGTVSNCAENCMTAYIYVNDETRTLIYNNLLVAPASAYVNHAFLELGALGGPTVSSKVLNNTVVCGSGTNAGGGIEIEAATTVTVENNAVVGCGTSGSLVGMWGQSITSWTPDYNAYDKAQWQWNSTLIGTIASWRTNSGGESHSFLGALGLGLNATTGVPSSASADVCGVGIDLSGLGITALNSDKAGTARSTWDIGAYRCP